MLTLLLPLPQQIEATNKKRMSSIKIGNHLPGLTVAPTNELALLWPYGCLASGNSWNLR